MIFSGGVRLYTVINALQIVCRYFSQKSAHSVYLAMLCNRSQLIALVLAVQLKNIAISEYIFSLILGEPVVLVDIVPRGVSLNRATPAHKGNNYIYNADVQCIPSLQCALMEWFSNKAFDIFAAEIGIMMTRLVYSGAVVIYPRPWNSLRPSDAYMRL